MRQGGYQRRWADSTNQYHTAQGRADGPKRVRGAESRERISRKIPELAWQGRTTHRSTLLQAGEAAPKWQSMPHPTQFPCSTWAVIGAPPTEVPGLAVGMARVVPYLASAPKQLWHAPPACCVPCRWAQAHASTGKFDSSCGSFWVVSMYLVIALLGTYPCRFQLFDGLSFPASLFFCQQPMCSRYGQLCLYFWHYISYIPGVIAIVPTRP